MTFFSIPEKCFNLYKNFEKNFHQGYKIVDRQSHIKLYRRRSTWLSNV